VKGAFVVVVGLIIEMVNQVSKTLDGNHALIHMVKSLINLPLILLALVLLLAAFRDLFRSPVSHE
jgi:membrane-associated PAP2 superfamily phosphatase